MRAGRLYTIDELRRIASQGEAAFTELLPHPALLVLSGPALDEAKKIVDTPDQGTALTQSDTGAFAIGSRAEIEQLMGPVIFVGKSGRNPFDTMITVGRAENNDIIFPTKSVSKFHAYFAAPSGPSVPWRLVDQRSKNGTTVDNVPLEPMTAFDLRDGLTLTFGDEIRTMFLLPSGLWSYLALTG